MTRNRGNSLVPQQILGTTSQIFANIQIHHFGTIDGAMQRSDEYRLLQIVIVRDDKGLEHFIMQQMKLGKASFSGGKPVFLKVGGTPAGCVL